MGRPSLPSTAVGDVLVDSSERRSRRTAVDHANPSAWRRGCAVHSTHAHAKRAVFAGTSGRDPARRRCGLPFLLDAADGGRDRRTQLAMVLSGPWSRALLAAPPISQTPL